jgi:hypothetical protein
MVTAANTVLWPIPLRRGYVGRICLTWPKRLRRGVFCAMEGPWIRNKTLTPTHTRPTNHTTPRPSSTPTTTTHLENSPLWCFVLNAHS